MKNCNDCNHNVSETAKTCPNCGADLRNAFEKIPRIVYWLILMCIFLLIFNYSDRSENSSTESNSNTNVDTLASEAEKLESNKIENITPDTANQPVIYRIGDLINTSPCDVMIIEYTVVDEFNSDGLRSETNSNNTNIMVSFKYTNKTNAPLSIWDSPTIHLYNSNDFTFEKSLDKTVYLTTQLHQKHGDEMTGSLNPNSTTHEGAVFEVSKELLKTGNWFAIIEIKSTEEFYYVFLEESQNDL